jgi:hypothetical protein
VTTARKIFCIAILLAGLVGIVGYYWLFAGDREPVYQGRKLSEWTQEVQMGYDLDEYRPEPRFSGEGVAAIRAMGDECLPLAVKWLSPDPADALKEKGLKLIESLNGKLGWSLFDTQGFEPHDKSSDGLKLFVVLGSNAVPAIPHLARLMESTNEMEAWHAATALGYIGPAALPTFLNALNSSNRTTVHVAMSALGELRTNAAAATPTLLRFLRSNHFGLADGAAFALVSINPDPAPVLLALLERLQTTRSYRPPHVMFAIAHYGTNASAATPLLVEIIESSSSILDCSGVIFALRKVNPELGTNYHSKLEAARAARWHRMNPDVPASLELPPEMESAFRARYGAPPETDATLTNQPSPPPP